MRAGARGDKRFRRPRAPGEPAAASHHSQPRPALCSLAPSCTGVYFEKYVKGKHAASLWVRNIQLGIYGVPLRRVPGRGAGGAGRCIAGSGRCRAAQQGHGAAGQLDLQSSACCGAHADAQAGHEGGRKGLLRAQPLVCCANLPLLTTPLRRPSAAQLMLCSKTAGRYTLAG